jgi:hypothetical protein
MIPSSVVPRSGCGMQSIEMHQTFAWVPSWTVGMAEYDRSVWCRVSDVEFGNSTGDGAWKGQIGSDPGGSVALESRGIGNRVPGNYRLRKASEGEGPAVVSICMATWAEKMSWLDAIKLNVRTPEIPYLARQLLDCLSDKSTRGEPGSRI